MNRALFVALTLIALAVSPAAVAQQRKASLARQKMCAEQAKKVFEEGKDDTSLPGTLISQEYVSHYDPRANVCYVMTHHEFRAGAELREESFKLTDAFEKHEFATYRWESDNSVRCYVFAAGHPKKCKTDTEFLLLVDKYFGISF